MNFEPNSRLQSKKYCFLVWTYITVCLPIECVSSFLQDLETHLSLSYWILIGFVYKKLKRRIK